MYTYTWTLVFFTALCGENVFGSYYHGPIAKPVVLKSGYLADTHEVAAAKSAHLATLAEQPYGYSDGQGYAGKNEYSQGDLRYHGPTAIPHVLHDGHIADTHEVAAAKAEHYAALAKAKSYTHGGEYEGDDSGSYSGESKEYFTHAVPYHGPFAKPVVLKSGYLADTHEVAAARQHHLQTLHSSHGNHYGYSH